MRNGRQSTRAEHLEGTAGDGRGRVRLAFAPNDVEVRVPPGVTVFDAASWNGVAIDSTCGGHGTCKKCRVRIEEGDAPVTKLDSARLLRPTSCARAGGWPAACRPTSDLALHVPPLQTRPKAATVGVGRQVILRPAVQKRYLELEEPTLHDQRTDVRRVLDAIDDIEARVELPVLRTLGKHAARAPTGRSRRCWSTTC